MIDEDRITIAERYASATHSSDLTPKTIGKTDADVLMAAAIAASGSARKRTALALYNVKVTGDKTGLMRALDDLESMLIDRRQQSGGRTITHRARRALLIDVVRWWLDPECSYCGGTGQVAIEEAGRLTGVPCSSCHGRGRRPLTREVPVQHSKEAQWVVDSIDEAVGWLHGEMARLLSQKVKDAGL